MYTLPDLPYTYDALEPYIDVKTMQIHHDKHHAAYVKNTNDALEGETDLLILPIEDLVSHLDRVPETVRTKVRNNAGGHYNHSMFWQSMAPKAGGVPQGDLAKAIDGTFGGFMQFQEKFSATAMARFGSGWAWLTVVDKKLMIESTPNQDSPLMESRVPILGLDVWEHAYYLKYQNMRADYIKAWWNVVTWPKVAERYAGLIFASS